MKKPAATILALSVALSLAACGGGANAPALTAEVGDVIQFGGYDWRVLEKRDGKALIVTEEITESRAYHGEWGDITWETCDLRAELNGGFYNSFGKKDRARIAKTVIVNEDNQWNGALGGEDTDDYVFLLSLEEVVRYFGDSGQLQEQPENDGSYGWWDEEYAVWIDDQYNDDRKAYYEGSASWWWLRSPGRYGHNAARVSTNGYIDVYGDSFLSPLGVRPALWLNL
ncbi:MAG: DUF6273 domain-containing protein [Oscillospiraceae bacterium]|jgi:hypothetical protein|nr:DUF6273 domain-containing protein [Oscillospiraceae bacterium]